MQCEKRICEQDVVKLFLLVLVNKLRHAIFDHFSNIMLSLTTQKKPRRPVRRPILIRVSLVICGKHISVILNREQNVQGKAKIGG